VKAKFLAWAEGAQRAVVVRGMFKEVVGLHLQQYGTDDEDEKDWLCSWIRGQIMRDLVAEP
jgi:hypothetical protein